MLRCLASQAFLGVIVVASLVGVILLGLLASSLLTKPGSRQRARATAPADRYFIGTDVKTAKVSPWGSKMI